MTKNIAETVVWALCFAICRCFAFEAPDAARLTVGDWVFRAGHGQESVLIRHLSNSDYSHIGMIVATAPQVLVVHATTNDDAARPNQIVLSRYDDFISPIHAEAIAVARPQFIDQAKREAAGGYLLKQVGLPFVLAPRNEQPRYCTTILLEAISASGVAFEPSWQTIDFALFRGEYLFPEAFARYPGIEWL